MVQVGVDPLGLQVFDIKITQVVVSHFARIKGFTAQLSQGHNSVASRSTACLPRGDGLHMRQQFGSTGRVNESHVALIDTHGFQKRVTDFEFRVDKGVAYGIEIVMRHELRNYSRIATV
jgi:hypothetical protein